MLALAGLDVADNIATVHGAVYKGGTYEPLNNTVIGIIDINSASTQSIVAINGHYSVKLMPGDYTIIARYYKDSTITYSIVDTIIIKTGGDYMYDLILPPVRGSIDETFIQKWGSQFWPVAFMLFLLLIGSNRLYRKHIQVDSSASQERKKGHVMRDFFETINLSKISVKALNKSISPERKETAESKEEHRIQETEPVVLRSEEENKETFLEKSVCNSKIETLALKRRLLLTPDLQEVLDIIRKRGGQITQKDLRSKLKHSEVKVCLMLADLEKRKRIKKFRRGRENIVVLIDRDH
ncbi:MAG: MarR family transcriptional regulator [Alphaproteobacteria bacterium]|nr:MAG: MarR family transcriptional regulator [Alphaproteobacteria bacterium]